MITYLEEPSFICEVFTKLSGVWLENQTLKSHDSADTRGKPTEFPYFLLSVLGRRKNKKDGRALVLVHFWGKRRMREVWLSSICLLLIWYFI